MQASFAVGFDFDHTLGFDNKLERLAWLRLIDAVVEDGGTAPRGDAVTMIDAVLAHQRSGAQSIDDAVSAFVAPLLAVGQDPRLYPALYRDLVLQMADDLVKPAPGAVELLRGLTAARIPVAILTNGWSPLQQRKAQLIHFEGPVLVSDQIGKQKPDPVAFAALSACFGLPPAQIWYVGDNASVDVAGAQAAGMRAIWVDEGVAAYPASLPPPAHRVRALSELVPLLGVPA